MKVLYLTLLILLSNEVYSQAIRLEVYYYKIPINHGKLDSLAGFLGKTKVLMVFEGDVIGIMCKYDTLVLEAKKSEFRDYLIATDTFHPDNQIYSIKKVVASPRFTFIIAPMKPYVKRHVYSIIIQSL